MGNTGGIFRFADNVDKLLMFFGTLGSIGEGLASPLTMYIASGVMDAFGTANQSIVNDVVDEYGLKLLYVALGVGFACFFEGICWTRTAERQASRIRTEYLYLVNNKKL